MKAIVFVILFLCLFNANLFGQNWVSNENNFETNWNLSVQFGRNALLGEVNSNFSGIGNDMNNQFDWGFNFQIGKMVWEKIDLGLEFGISNFKGYKDNPSNISWLMNHTDFNDGIKDFRPSPIYYDSDFTNFAFYTKYNFINFKNFSHGFFKLNIYMKAGIGILFPSVELGYKEYTTYKFTNLPSPLYLRGRYPYPSKSAHLFFSPAFGLNYQLSDRFFFSLESGFQMINAGYLDGVLNYSDELTPDVSWEKASEYKIKVYELSTKFMLGISYFFNFDSQKQARQKYLPWFSNRYRSYYSKFQTQSTKKARQERLPFYHDKFKADRSGTIIIPK